MDSRVVVDLRWFGMVEPNAENKVTFETEYQDLFQMPQPTFQFSLGEEDRRKAGRMMDEYVDPGFYLSTYSVGFEDGFC